MAGHPPRDLGSPGVLDHAALLTLARKAHAAAVDANVSRLGDELFTFVQALAVHVDEEAQRMTAVPPAEERLLHRGQHRIEAAARALLEQTDVGCASHPAACAARLEELLALMELQARDERLALQAAAAAPFPAGGGVR